MCLHSEQRWCGALGDCHPDKEMSMRRLSLAANPVAVDTDPVAYLVKAGHHRGMSRRRFRGGARGRQPFLARPVFSCSDLPRPTSGSAGMRVRHPQHRVQDDAGMLGRPGGGIIAVHSLVPAAQMFTLIPQPARDVHTARPALEVNPRRHHAGRKQRIPVRAPRIGPGTRPRRGLQGPTSKCLGHRQVLPLRLAGSWAANNYVHRRRLTSGASVVGGALADTGWCGPLRHPSHPRAWGWRAV